MDCGALKNPYGPFDYTSSVDRREKLPIVENRHWSTDVQALKKGATGSLGHDLDYILRAFPNHHPALHAMGKYQLRNKHQFKPEGANWPADCYFERAIRFRPDDSVVMMLYGIYLNKKGETDRALSKYQSAYDLAPTNPEINYNLGLFYMELNLPDKALFHANIAYSAGFPLVGLQRKLEKIGLQVEGQ